MIATLVMGLVVALAPLGTAPTQGQAPADDCGCDAQQPDTFAVVNGTKVSAKEIEEAAEPLVAPLREQMSAARAQALDQLISLRLLENEAAKRGIPKIRLIQSEVYEKVPDPTDDEVRAFYDRVRAQIGKPYEAAAEELHEFIRAQRNQIQVNILLESLRSAARIERLDASAAGDDRARTVATVDGVKITSGDVDDAVRAARYEYQRRVYEIEKALVDDRIADLLIAGEAARRSVAPQALVDTEVAPLVKKVDPFDVSTYYTTHKDQFAGRAFASVKDQIADYLLQLERVKAKQAYASKLRASANVVVSLVEPAPPTYPAEIADRATLGPAAAPVTIVEFSDFQCPRCAKLHADVEALAKTYPGKVRVVARYYPLEQHPFALKAAEAAEAAREQGKFWEYSALLFENQKDLSVEKLKALASTLGLDRAKFDAALASGKFAPAVAKDLSDGERLGVSSTPYFFVNGVPFSNASADSLKAAIDAAIARANGAKAPAR